MAETTVTRVTRGSPSDLDVSIEYLVEELPFGQGPEFIQSFLNTLGIDHWRLVHIQGGMTKTYGIFSRQLNM